MLFITRKIWRDKLFISKITLFFLPFSALCQSQQVYYQAKLDSYFSKDKEVLNYVRVDEKGIAIYANPETKGQDGKPEIRLNWQQVDSLKKVISGIPEKEAEKLIASKDSMSYFIQKDSLLHTHATQLKGMRIAIDPGHLGGSYEMGEIEARCMKLGIDSTHCIQLEEGNLTFATANILKKKLEAQGAIVMLTRPDTGVSSLGITYYEWKRRMKSRAYEDSLLKVGLLTDKEVRSLHINIDDSSVGMNKGLFSNVFSSMDLSERSRKINEFNPDLTVIIHYNVNEKNKGWTHTTDKDFVMAFVGGCISSKDLKSYAGRVNFLRLLITDDIENSIQLSSLVVNNLSKDLKVPVVKREDASYLSEHCLSTPKEGVYSRDLALARLTQGTLVYGEPLYQDNAKECMLLSGAGENITGGNTPSRIEMVANAYYKGILDYVNGKK